MILRDAFLSQSEACAHLGSAFMARLMSLCAERIVPGTGVADRLLEWGEDAASWSGSAPPRLAGGLHALVLTDQDAALKSVYPPNAATDDAIWQAVQSAFTTHAGHLLLWLDSPPQTNEVRRAAAVIPAALMLVRTFNLPLDLTELGASAGLNLMFDRYALEGLAAPEHTALTLSPIWTGPRPDSIPFGVRHRRGVDLNPLNPKDPDDQLRLLSYLWPDQPERQTLTRAAIAITRAPIDKADVADWLALRLAPRPGAIHLIFHTVAWQYFPPDVQATCARDLEHAGHRATSDAPIAWLSMEYDGPESPGAELRLRVWPGDYDLVLARVDFHGRWIDWTGPTGL